MAQIDMGHTTLIARLEGEQIRVLDVALGTSEFSIVQRPGNVLASDMLHCSALGKIALAFGPRDLVRWSRAHPVLDNAFLGPLIFLALAYLTPISVWWCPRRSARQHWRHAPRL